MAILSAKDACDLLDALHRCSHKSIWKRCSVMHDTLQLAGKRQSGVVPTTGSTAQSAWRPSVEIMSAIADRLQAKRRKLGAGAHTFKMGLIGRIMIMVMASGTPGIVAAQDHAATLPPIQKTMTPTDRSRVGNDVFGIVSVDWLAQHANDPNLRILDVRWDVHDYLAFHIPNAVHIPAAALQSTIGGLPAQYIEPESMASLFGRAGIGPDTTVVIYSEGENVLDASLVAYSLQRIGHDKTLILDGGYDDYRLKHPLTQAYPENIRPTNLKANLNKSIFVTHEQVRKMLGKKGVVLLDARPPFYYLGNTHQWMRNGHIPGAIDFNWKQMTYADAPKALRNPHRLKPVDEIRAMVEATGISKDDQIIVYCGTSREASLLFEVIKNVLGYSNARLYEGSWTEWSSLAGYPMETEGRVVKPTPLSATKAE